MAQNETKDAKLYVGIQTQYLLTVYPWGLIIHKHESFWSYCSTNNSQSQCWLWEQSFRADGTLQLAVCEHVLLQATRTVHAEPWASELYNTAMKEGGLV